MPNHRTILIVDDVALFRELGSLFLARSGRILTAKSGEEGLAIAREERPDLILTDLSMPGMDGAALCRALKQDPELCHIPVLVLLGRHVGPDRARAIRAGADDTLEKPLDRMTLVDAVTRFLRFDVPRGLPRVEVAIPCAIELGDLQLEGTLRNVSRGGVFVETPAWIARKMEVGLRFQLPESATEFAPTAQVVWSSESAGQSDTRGIGLRFLELDRRASRTLDDYVLEHMPTRVPLNA